mmetsp:Transcript_87415/g.228075  ORF Transcript_87415/g.228075 Transcript_87415/m.228075 type:complete len:225 (+) Transcript_87415:186-860(+)
MTADGKNANGLRRIAFGARVLCPEIQASQFVQASSSWLVRLFQRKWSRAAVVGVFGFRGVFAGDTSNRSSSSAFLFGLWSQAISTDLSRWGASQAHSKRTDFFGDVTGAFWNTRGVDGEASGSQFSSSSSPRSVSSDASSVGRPPRAMPRPRPPKWIGRGTRAGSGAEQRRAMGEQASRLAGDHKALPQPSPPSPSRQPLPTQLNGGPRNGGEGRGGVARPWTS